MSTWAHGTSPTKSARNSAAVIAPFVALADVLHIGDRRIDQLAVRTMKGELPLASPAASPAARRSRTSPRSVPNTPARSSPSAPWRTPVRYADGARLLLGQVGERVREHQTALGVGVQDLGRLAGFPRWWSTSPGRVAEPLGMFSAEDRADTLIFSSATRSHASRRGSTPRRPCRPSSLPCHRPRSDRPPRPNEIPLLLQRDRALAAAAPPVGAPITRGVHAPPPAC